MSNDEIPETMSVPEAGRKYFDLSRNASYDAARRGDIPTVRVGRLLRVPTRTMERKLDAVTSNSNATRVKGTERNEAPAI